MKSNEDTIVELIKVIGECLTAMRNTNTIEEIRTKIEDCDKSWVILRLVLLEHTETLGSTLELQSYHRSQDNHFSLSVSCRLCIIVRFTIELCYNILLKTTDTVSLQLTDIVTRFAVVHVWELIELSNL